MDLDDDPRWLRLHDPEWTCSCCGAKHGGLFDLGSACPDAWRGRVVHRPNSKLHTSNHILTEDFCITHGEHFFVRCVLQLPVVAKPSHALGFGVWSTLSRANFDQYLETFDAGEQEGLGPWFGWFNNRLGCYPDTLNLPCQVRPRGGRQRPIIEFGASDHPLAIEQRDGITFDRILEIYAFYGHDLGPAFSN